ncbi:hypothetical protein LG634_14530 [Streptomyces bambusae]|uniref:hypothetical protein n=1 Tax=Streptomyces bambusae TaxID=1550616 RepID=UPI001CFC83AC|nr:hypothetical protein [Streptomyces bambusae]MCB5166048.1 hypothetical protein [Streptomyces bambusae]
MTHVTAVLPVLASTELDIFDADQRRRIPASEAIARMTPVPVSATEHAFAADAVERIARRADALAATSTPPITPRAARVLEGIEKAKEGQPQNYRSFLDLVAIEIRQAGDSEAVLARVLEIITTARAKDEPAPAPCPVHAWCTETGDHVEHTGATLEAACTDGYGEAVLPAVLLDWGTKGVTVGLLDLDLSPAEARVKVAELRAHLDRVEALIDTAEKSAR